MTDTQKYKLLPAGGDTYSEIITKNKYYVDKTLYLRSVFAEDGSSVLLFTRPLRFGKMRIAQYRITQFVLGDHLVYN